jgi:hypothetical protein
MNQYAVTQLAEIRREELIFDATIFRQSRVGRTSESANSRRHPRWRMSGFHAWVAAGQL